MSKIKEHYHDQIEAGQRGHKISWLNMPGYRPETWNPVVGCTKVSPGCEHCYAEVMATRLAGIAIARVVPMSIGKYVKVIKGRKWDGTTFMNEEEIYKPMGWKTPRMIFVCSMGDLFHESVPFAWIDKVWNVIEVCDSDLFIILTKRPARMLEYINFRIARRMSCGHSNVWMGVTAESQEQANIRIPILLQVPAAKRFVSVEPMLGPIDFYDVVIGMEFYNTLEGFGDISGGDFGIFGGRKLDWVICGGESGPKARPMHPDWVRMVRDQCKKAGTPFFFKGWGTYRPLTTTKLIERLPFADYDVRTKLGFVRKTKHMVGASVDGCYHEEWPKG